MSVPPSLKATAYQSTTSSKHTLEVFVDPCCPFSAKITFALRDFLLDQLKRNHTQLLIRPYPQPWHCTSPLMTESVVLAAQLDSSFDLFFKYLTLIMTEQKRFFDVPSQDMTPNQIRAGLAELLTSVYTKYSKDDILSKLSVAKVGQGETLNGGSSATTNLKWFVKYGRQCGVHSTPTVLWNGLINDSISSGWTQEQWSKFLDENAK